jgi:hypothetical protein
MTCLSRSGWKKIVTRLQPCLRNPRIQRVPSLNRDFKLNRLSGLLLNDHCSWQYLITVGHVSDAERHQIAAAKLAVDGKIEQSEIAGLGFVLKAEPDCPYFLKFEW